MRRVRAAALFAGSVTLLGTLAAGVSTPAQAATSYTLYVSTHSNRSHAAKLSHQSVRGNVYIYATPASGALRVKFYIDDPHRRHAPVHTETSPPYDLRGGSLKRPNSYNTNQLSNGKHTLTIQVDMPLKKTFRSTTSFTVHNVPPKPTHVHATAGHGQVKVTWHSGTRHSGDAAGVGFYVYRSTHAKVSLSHPLGGKLLSAKKRTASSTTRSRPGPSTTTWSSPWRATAGERPVPRRAAHGCSPRRRCRSARSAPPAGTAG